MIKVRVKRDKGGNPLSVEIKGHALFAPRGRDIVCAAVSALAQTTIYALEDLVGIKPSVHMAEGYLLIAAPPLMMEREQKEKYCLLMETMLLGLKETAKAYPEHLSFKTFISREITI